MPILLYGLPASELLDVDILFDPADSGIFYRGQRSKRKGLYSHRPVDKRDANGVCDEEWYN